MPYTNPWTDNTPVGGDAASGLSSDLRRLKLDIAERMESIIPGWQTDDPVSLIPFGSSIEFAKSYVYDASLALPAVSATIIRSCLILDVQGHTNIFGHIFIDFQPGEFDESWDLTPASLVGIVPMAWWNDDVNDFAYPFLEPPFIAGNVITLTIKDHDGSIAGTDDVRGRLLLFFGTIALPTLISIVPNSGAQGASVPVTLNGTNFVGTDVQINVSGTGITVASIVIVSTTQINATFNIDVAAPLGVRTVSVTTVGGNTGTVNFTVV